MYEKINDGAGAPSKPGDVAVFHWILRRANGYFIYGTIDCGIGCGNGDPSEYKLGPDGKLIAGLDELLTGKHTVHRPARHSRNARPSYSRRTVVCYAGGVWVHLTHASAPPSDVRDKRSALTLHRRHAARGEEARTDPPRCGIREQGEAQSTRLQL